MRILIVLTASALALVLATASNSHSEPQSGRITITVKNFSGFDKTFDLKDGRCGNESTLFLREWATTSVSLCTSEAGYGNLLYKKHGDNGWTQSGLLSNGDNVSM